MIEDVSAYVSSEEEISRIENIFVYHAPSNSQIDRYAHLRNQAKGLAYNILAYTPKSREQSLALTALQEAVMWANAAIAINESNKSGE